MKYEKIPHMKNSSFFAFFILFRSCVPYRSQNTHSKYITSWTVENLLGRTVVNNPSAGGVTDGMGV